MSAESVGMQPPTVAVPRLGQMPSKYERVPIWPSIVVDRPAIADADPDVWGDQA